MGAMDGFPPRRPEEFRRPGRPTLQLDGGRVLAAADAVEELRVLGLDRLEAALAWDRGEAVRPAGRRCTWRVPGPRGVLYLKVYRGLPLGERFRRLRDGRSPARREWDAIQELRRLGFDVPEPVAVGEAAAFLGAPTRSFLLTREVPGVPLDRLLAAGWPDPHGLGPARAREAVLRDLAGLVRRFHANGFFHRDLYCGHFLVAPDPRWGRPFLLDLARLGRGFPPRRRWLVKDLAALDHSAPAAVTRADRLRFLLRYLCKDRVDPEARRWIRAIRGRVRRTRRHVPRHG